MGRGLSHSHATPDRQTPPLSPDASPLPHVELINNLPSAPAARKHNERRPRSPELAPAWPWVPLSEPLFRKAN